MEKQYSAVFKTVKKRRAFAIVPIQCGKEYCKPGYFFGPAARDFYLLHFVRSGKGRYVVDGKEYELAENDIFIIRPYKITYYEADKLDPWEYIWLGFTSEDKLPKLLSTTDVIHAPELREIFEKGVDASEFDNSPPNGGYEMYLSGLILQLCGMLRRLDGDNGLVIADHINKATSIIKSEYHMPINVEIIADRLHISRSYFTSIFTESVGVPPHKYLRNYRMKKAAEYLCNHKINVADTARSVGYTDVFVFSSAFKRHFGISPSEYVKKYNTHNVHST